MSKQKTPTQTDLIRQHLESGKYITGLDALNLYGCFRLAARIGELKDEGFNIKSQFVKTPGGATISQYWLPSSINQNQGELF